MQFICRYCGKKFIPSPYSAGKYCSCDCYHKSTKHGMHKQCKYCGKIFYVHPSRTHKEYCSQKCWRASKLISKTCAICGKEFRVLRSIADRYNACSLECRRKFTLYKKCEICGKIFRAEHPRRRHCSKECRWEAETGKKRWEYAPKIKLVCKQCNKIFYAWPSRTQKYCSRLCAGEAKRGEGNINYKAKSCFICAYCQKEFRVNPSQVAKGRTKHCSQSCQIKDRWGKGNPNWQGGKSFEPYGPEFNQKLKEQIRLRDGEKCRLCGEPANDRCLDVHHIDYDKTNNKLENLITLCFRCHVKTNFNRPYWQSYFTNLMQGGLEARPRHFA